MLSENNPFIIPWNDLRCSATDCLWKAEKALVMAGVYNRRRGGRDIPVAIKIFINRSLSTATFAEEAMKEAHIMMQAEGSHVTKVYGLACGMLTEPMLKALGNHMGTCPDTVVTAIVMELVPGGSLEALLSSPDRIHSPLTMEVKVRLLLDIATGLTDLHEKNIVHGDLKPQNILMVVDGRSKLTDVGCILGPLLKLSDFGLSRQVKSLNDFQKSSMEQTKTVYGTLMYLAPEILQQQQSGMYRRASRSTDIYAFGILMHYILSEKKPFESIHSVLSSIVNGYRPHSDELPKDTPATVIDLMHRCWSPDRTTRPTAVECFSILRQLNETLRGDHFDIFFSHPWVNKPFLCHVYKLLVREGYRVWYDQQRMRHDMGESMREGIEKSTVVMACINELYESRKNCMFELEVAKQCNKPIVSVFIEPDFCDKASVTLQNLCEFGPDHPQGKMFTTALADIAVLDWETDDGPSSALMQKLRESLKDVVGLLSKSDCLPSLQDHFGTNASAAYEASQDLSHVSNSTTIDPQLVLQDNIRTTDLINSLVACFPDMEVSRATSYGIKFYQELDLTSMKRLIKEVGSQTDGTQWLIDNGVDQLDADDIVELSNSNGTDIANYVQVCITVASSSPPSRARSAESDNFLTHCCPDIEPTHAAHYCEDLKRSWNIHTAERMVKVITKRGSLWSDIIKDDSIHRLDVDDINEFVSNVQAVMDEEHLTLRVAIDRTITDSVTTLPANTPDSISWLADYLCDMHPEKAAEYGKTLSDLNIHTMRRVMKLIQKDDFKYEWLCVQVGMHKFDADDLISYTHRNKEAIVMGVNAATDPAAQLNTAFMSAVIQGIQPERGQKYLESFEQKNIHTINRLVRRVLLMKENAGQWLQDEFELHEYDANDVVQYVNRLGLSFDKTVVTSSASSLPVLAPRATYHDKPQRDESKAMIKWLQSSVSGIRAVRCEEYVKAFREHNIHTLDRLVTVFEHRDDRKQFALSLGMKKADAEEIAVHFETEEQNIHLMTTIITDCCTDMAAARAEDYVKTLNITNFPAFIQQVRAKADDGRWLIDNGVDQLDADDIVELSNSIDNWANFTDCVEACTTLASNSPSSRGRAHDSDDFLTHCCPDIEPTHAAHYCEDLKRSRNIHTAERMVKVITKRRSLWSDIIKDDSIHRLDVDDINEFVSKVQAVMDEEHLTLRIAIDRTITDSVTTLPANTPDSISWLADYLCDMHPEKAAEYGKTLSDLNIHTMRRLVRCIMNISLRASLRRKWLREEVGMHKYDADDLLSYCVRNADFETLVEVGHNTTANPETQLNYALSFLHMDPVKRQDLVKRFKEKNIHTINRLVRQILLAKESAVQWLQTEFLLDMQSAEEMVRYVGGLGLTLPMTVVTASISCVPVKSLAPHRSQSLNNNMPPIPAQTEWDLDFSSLSFKNGGTLFPHGGKLLGYENETLDVPMKAKCTLNAPLLTNPCVKSASTAMARDLLAQPQLAKQLKQLAKNFLSEKGSEQINAKDSPVDKSIDNSIDSLKEMFKFNSSTCAVGAKAAKKLSPNQNLSFSLKLAGNDADIEHQSSAAVSLQNLHVSSALQPIEEDGDREDQGSAAVSLVTEDPNDFADGRNSTTVNDMRGSEVPWFELYPY